MKWEKVERRDGRNCARFVVSRVGAVRAGLLDEVGNPERMAAVATLLICGERPELHGGHLIGMRVGLRQMEFDFVHPGLPWVDEGGDPERINLNGARE